MFLDIGVGILITLGIASAQGVPATAWVVLFGIASALFPDIDLLLTKSTRIRALIGEHRSALHYPFVYLCSAPVLLLGLGTFYGSIFILGVFYHLVHDTFFLGWGIKWLWPFSNRLFSFFHDKAGRITWSLLAWDPEDDARIRKEYATEHWITRFYFRPSIISLTEYPVFVCALVYLFKNFYS